MLFRASFVVFIIAFGTPVTESLTESEVDQDPDKCPKYCSIAWCDRKFSITDDIKWCEKAQKDCNCVKDKRQRHEPPVTNGKPASKGNPAIYVPVGIALFIVMTIVNIYIRKMFCPNNRHKCEIPTCCKPRKNSTMEVLSAPVTSTVHSSNLDPVRYPATFIVDSQTKTNNNF